MRPGKHEPGGSPSLSGPADALPALPNPRTEHLDDDEVLAYATGRLAPEQEDSIRGHLYTCASCGVLVAEATRSLTTQPPAGEAPAPGARAGAGPTTLSVGELLLGRYRVRRFLARGGMGEVYEAHDSVLEETVALKTLVCTALDNPAAMSRFLAEVRTARHVTHRNICRILEFGFHCPRGSPSGEQVPFLTMEFLAGETLSARIARKGRLAPAEVAALLPQIVAGVSAIHAAGIVHRDIKPQNIVILPGPPERVVVTDFGVARALDAERSLDTGPFMVGTADYMSPEQIEGLTPTPAFDVFALGVVVFEMLTGRTPFNGPGRASALQRIQRAAPDPSSLIAGLDRGWDQLVARCLASNPSRRFTRVEEIVAPARAPRSPWALPRATRILASAAAVALVLLVVLAGIQLARGRLELGPRRLVEQAPAPGDPRPRGFPPARPLQRAFGAAGCSLDMVAVQGPSGRFCIDRFEASVVDDVQGLPLSPRYPPWGPLARAVHRDWSERLGQGRAGPSGVALPPIVPHHLEGRWLPRAVSAAGVTPQGHVSQQLARVACADAGKRLCTEPEWRTACRGAGDQRGPAGPAGPAGCNIGGDVHPALVLHGVVHAGVLTDPRLNAVTAGGKALLEPTGGRAACASPWGADRVHDLIGNLEEWVDGPQPIAMGGSYTGSRSGQTAGQGGAHGDLRDGCDLRNDRHRAQGPGAYNFATGFRCCDDRR